jgi:hypothetical protein
MAEVRPVLPGKTGFTLLLPAETGITFTNVLPPARYLTNHLYLNGAGVAAGDVDGDGWCDLYFCGLDRPNVLYRNLGNWRFDDVTSAAGVAMTGFTSTGATFADLDGDGDLDLLVNTFGHGTHVFLNDGRGHFAESNPGAPLNAGKTGTTLALADIDGNGTLDLYVANYRTDTISDTADTRLSVRETAEGLVVVAVNGRPVTEPDLIGRFTVTRDGRYVENGEADVLYLNDGQGHFTAVPFTGGAFLDEEGQPLRQPPYDWGLTAMLRDLNGDGAPDLYVCNDFDSPDRIWFNDGRGHFRAADRLAFRCTSIFSMGVDVADVNSDGFDDLFVSDMLSQDHAKRMLETGDIRPLLLPVGVIDNRPQYSRNTLFLNRGDGTYAEVAQYAGVEASEWTWSPVFLDVDLDGREDLLITTGHELQMMNGDIIERAEAMKAQRAFAGPELQRLRAMFPRNATPKVAFRNRGDGTFADMSAAWGFNRPGVGNALTLADLDQDGDLDVIVNNLNGVAEVYRNDGAAPRVAVRLRGRPPNTQGIGARLVIRDGPVARQSQELLCGGRYLSGAEAMRVFAAGNLTNHLTLEVTWRNGGRSVVSNALPNHFYEFNETSAAPPTSPPGPAPAPPPLFADATDRLRHQHHEDPFDDFARQPLLPRRLSQLGPGVSWLDVNGDGRDDLLIGSGRGGQLACYLNLANGQFQRDTNAVFAKLAARDQTTILGFGPALLVGSSNYEDGLTNGGALRVYDLARKVTGESVLAQPFSSGPLAFGDVDGDGPLELFLGGRVVPGRYPEPATSLLLKTEGGRFTVKQRFERLGLVSGAVFTDLDGDGLPELVLACEWGPVRILRHERDQLVEWDPPVAGALPGGSGLEQAVALPPGCKLSQLTGWWTGVASGDIDGDGRMDLVVANWGLNSRYHPTLASPIRLHYGDFGGGGVDVIESCLNPATGQEVPRRGRRAVVAALPFLQEKAATYEAYGRATLAGLYGDRLGQGRVVEATVLASVALLNRGERFVVVPLPAEAQWAPAFGVCIADFDGDGAEDLFLSQNFFGVNADEWRHDAGRGLLLRGDGRGGLTPMSGQASGIAVYGEQRGCAVADYDGDGRMDLAVSQNGNATRLYHNVGARAGLRLRLAGPPGNVYGVGASVRLKFGERFGPAREVQAGSGYWSVNSVVLVMATPAPPTEVWVRWPGGKTTVSAVATDRREMIIAFP